MSGNAETESPNVTETVEDVDKLKADITAAISMEIPSQVDHNSVGENGAVQSDQTESSDVTNENKTLESVPDVNNTEGQMESVTTTSHTMDFEQVEGQQNEVANKVTDSEMPGNDGELDHLANNTEGVSQPTPGRGCESILDAVSTEKPSSPDIVNDSLIKPIDPLALESSNQTVTLVESSDTEKSLVGAKSEKTEGKTCGLPELITETIPVVEMRDPANSKVEIVNSDVEATNSKVEVLNNATSGTDNEVEGATAAVPSASEASCASAASPTAEGSAPLQSVYHVKWIQYKSQRIPIVTQNENGPCPLLAIMNVLLLQEKVKFPTMIEMVTSGQLMDYLGDCIFENSPNNISEAARLNYEQNMQDAMAVFHKLQTGLDVNVRFTGISDFEYTPECIVFDLLNIPLYHGWLVDPESPEMVTAVGNCSYNQLVEKIIANKNTNKEELVTEALLAEEFLERTAAQLTYHGLSELATQVKEGEPCVFFRNNHFSTLLKHKNELFLLVTDQGFLTEFSVVWETLCNVEGDGHFVDGDFRTYTKPEPPTNPVPDPTVAVGSDQQIDQDYLVALSLQQEQQSAMEAQTTPPNAWPQSAPTSLSDHELALRLQEEENQRAAAAAAAAPQHRSLPRQQSHSSQRGAEGSKKKSNDVSNTCLIL